MEQEKADGNGLPVEVTNQVAQAQMVGQVDAENQVAMANAMPQDPTQSGGSSSSSSSTSSKPKDKSKSESSSVKGDLSLKEDNTFTKLKRIL
jgi:hypothetical protein